MTTLTLDRPSTKNQVAARDARRAARGGAFRRLLVSQREVVQRAVGAADDFDRARSHAARLNVLENFTSTSSR